MLLTENNIKSELSYAYLHAVASRAGIGCEVTGRHGDAAGVDATVRARERFGPNSKYTDFTAEVQLKATSDEPAQVDDMYSFWLALDHYNKLRTVEVAAPRILVVMFLPKDPLEWLQHSEDALIAKRCAYWVSLRGAPASDNKSGQTIYLPKRNVFSVDALRSLMATFSRGERIPYALP